MDPRIISTLKYNTILSLIKLINAQRPCIYIALFFNPICHKKSLIWFLIS